MAQTFQKPENALRRAEELIEVGKKVDALETLHSALQHRKFRNLWTTVIEKIMIKHLELCVELKKMKHAREGLYQYRQMCQAANISSLETVVKKFREAAESKVNEAKKQKDIQMAELGDLDEDSLAPQTIMLRAIQANDTRQQSQDRDVHMHFRFLWDTYKVILDVLKSITASRTYTMRQPSMPSTSAARTSGTRSSSGCARTCGKITLRRSSTNRGRRLRRPAGILLKPSTARSRRAASSSRSPPTWTNGAKLTTQLPRSLTS
jgi:hypothetical protein